MTKSIAYSKIDKGSSYGSTVKMGEHMDATTPINGNSHHETNHNNGSYTKKDE